MWFRCLLFGLYCLFSLGLGGFLGGYLFWISFVIEYVWYFMFWVFWIVIVLLLSVSFCFWFECGCYTLLVVCGVTWCLVAICMFVVRLTLFVWLLSWNGALLVVWVCCVLIAWWLLCLFGLLFCVVCFGGELLCLWFCLFLVVCVFAFV